jgi:serine/threonine protein phosphatase PrpC
MMDSGELVPWGPLRVCAPESGEAKGGIALSRALGLFPFKPAVGSAPDAIRIERRDDDLFLVMGSDGVFEVLSPERVREIIVASPSAQDAAEAIIDAVLSGGAPDNAIVIVVDLREQTL